MKRRTMIQSGIGGLAAVFSASAFASTKLKGNEKMMPVDTLNHEPGWDKEPVEVLEIKGVRIGEGRPKIIASTTAKTPEAFIALVQDYNSRPELQMIELRPDYIGEISGKEFAKLTKQVYEIVKNKPILMTFRDKTEGAADTFPTNTTETSILTFSTMARLTLSTSKCSATPISASRS